jgi:TonB family protein
LRRSFGVFICLAHVFWAVYAAAAPAEQANPARTTRLLTVDIALAADGTSVTTVHAEIRANNAASAMSLGQMAVSYDSDDQDLQIVEAYTQKADGQKIPVDAGAIYDQLTPGAAQVPMFTDLRMKTIVFPQLSAQDVAVYTARITTKRAIFPGQFWYGENYPRDMAFDEVRETLTAPKSLRLFVENHDVAFDKTEQGDKTIYHWHYSDPHPAAPEPIAVSPLKHLPHFSVTTFPDYAALGRTYASAAASASAVTPKIQSLADDITKGITDPRQQTRALYTWLVGHIRYVAVELGRGTLIPHAADAVLANGYGDCKDHVALFAALLKAKGIASEGVLINAGNDYALEDVPVFTGLNHIITFIPSFDLYLDSTALVAPFGVLPFQEYGKPVVYTSETNPRRGTTPTLPPGTASVSLKTVSHLTKEGVLSGTTTMTATGPYSITLRIFGLGVQSVGAEAAAKQLLTNAGYGNNPSGTFDPEPPLQLADSYTITGRFTTDSWTKEAAGTQQFYIPGGMRLLGLSGDGAMGDFSGSSLKPDAEIPCYSVHASEDLSLEAPPGQQFSNVPPDVHVKTAYLTYDAHWTLDKGTISVHRVFTSNIDRPLCNAAIRAANTKALDEINDSYNVQLSLGDQSAVGAAQQADPKLAAEIENVRDALQRGDENVALPLLSDMLKQPDASAAVSYPARLTRASIYAHRWRYNDALADLNAVLATNPGDAHALAERAQVYFLMADFIRALNDTNAALASAPGDVGALNLRGNIAMENGRYADAVRDYTQELQITQYANVFVLRAIAYHKLGRETDAKADIDKAVQLADPLARSDYDAIVSGKNDTPPKEDAVADTSTPAGTAPPRSASAHHSYYPPLSRRLGEQGEARVSFTIEPDGTVSDPKIAASSGFPALDAAGLVSVKTWRYRPAVQDGKPVASPWQTIVRWAFQ